MRHPIEFILMFKYDVVSYNYLSGKCLGIRYDPFSLEMINRNPLAVISSHLMRDMLEEYLRARAGSKPRNHTDEDMAQIAIYMADAKLNEKERIIFFPGVDYSGLISIK